jgi:hypothetical protein
MTSIASSKTLAAKAPPVALPPVVSRTKILHGLKCDFGHTSSG